ncbi:MFS transporter [Sphingomonas sp. SUN039]|uniref:MFS transporter n=1 Tax=Sphingomonas sp. SUN039 TaxID=2937787 RepID=UPI0021647AD4|nr:MFS transporter [Sphingomonas sp. SUN039]UVO53926.1 MFS transporter [Sphingomonas sp. SUN039]
MAGVGSGGAPTLLTPARRWILFVILALAGISNAMDRQIIALLKFEMSGDLGWTDQDYANLAAYFQYASAAAFLFTGWLVDRLGVKWGNVVGVGAWSIAAAAHGWASSMWQFIACRIGLGATESMGTPLNIKTISTLFEPDRRSFAVGLLTLIAAVGLVSMPFVIPWLESLVGWRGAFILAGLSGIVIIVLWLGAFGTIKVDDGHETVVADGGTTGDSYGPILANRQTWGIAVAKALSDATWWLMLYWLPDFYRKTFGLKGTDLAVAMAIAFIGSGVGAFFWGWLSTRLLDRGWNLNRVRKGVMLASALVVLPVPFVLYIGQFWPVAIMMAFVLAGHQGFSLSIFSTITDIAPRAKVARLTAFGAFVGNVGGGLIQPVTAAVLGAGLGYLPLFVFAGFSYLLALGWLQLFIPVIRRAPDAGSTPVAAH